MKYITMREELKKYYLSETAIDNAREISKKCYERLNAYENQALSVMEQKLTQYKIIVEEMDPIVFPNCPFYYETAVLIPHSDGSRYAREYPFKHAASWVYERNKHLYNDENQSLMETKIKQSDEILYLICGDFNDTHQHFNFNNRPILKKGLKGIYEEALQKLNETVEPNEREFLNGVATGMLRLKEIVEKFSNKAALMAKEANDSEKENLLLIAKTAANVPWEAPQSLYEALCTLAFMRKAFGSLEGAGANTFGRLDVDLYPFYEADINSGRLTKETAYELIAKFLIIWDCHYDHDMPMVGYCDHELENTYTIGGCDREGNVVYNDLTSMFLRATREEKIIFPKIKCRFSSNSPKEYFDEINLSIIKGTSTILYQNDDATIPAIVRNGRKTEDARDYFVSGCWGIVSNDEKYDHGNYLNLLKALELPLHNLNDVIEKIKIPFKRFDDAKSYEEFYQILVDNIRMLIEERIRITREGGHIWGKVDAYPIFSSTLEGCMENKRDFHLNGARYRDDYLLCFGFPNIVDSLLAIKTLCFDEKRYTLSQMLTAVRNNWNGYEDMRQAAIRCHGWGDGNEDSSSLANTFNNDIFNIADSINGGYGGKVHIGHLTYTEIRFWGEKTLATPDGRYNGDYFSQGLTPSRLKKIPSVTSVINSLSKIDKSTLGANSVVNILLPSKNISLDICEAFLRTVANSAIQSLQLNCVTKEQLLDAQKHPEKYSDLIVRVTGFSAKFTSLSPEWQQEILTRNFYE